MADNIDYRNVELRDGVDPTEYRYTERRKEILNLIERTGDPRAVPQRKLAERYGVTQSQISQDFTAIREYIEMHVGSNAVAMTDTLLHRTVEKYVERGEPEKAFEYVLQFNRWLMDTGRQERAPDRIEMLDGDKSGSYEIIADDDAISGETVDVASIRTGSAASREEQEGGE